MKQIRKRLTYANVMSTIAVFLVLGGASALAAAQLGKNTVGTNQLKKNAVTAAKIKNGAVSAGKLAAGAVGTAQIGKAAVNAEKLAAGSVTGEKLGDNAVTATKIANGAVSGAKLTDNSVSSTKLAEGAVTGTKIAAGSVSASKLGPITVQTEAVNVAKETTGEINVDCPAGQRAISGGGAWGAFIKGLSFLASRPIRSSGDSGPMADGEVAGGWRTSGFNESPTTATSIIVWVLCAQ